MNEEAIACLGPHSRKEEEMRVLKQPSPVQVMTGQKQLENYDYLNYLASLTKFDARYAPEIESGLPWQKRLSTRRRLLSTENWNALPFCGLLTLIGSLILFTFVWCTGGQ
jgi:hypothetical protein